MKIATFGGIGVYIHWTFWLLIVAYLVSVTLSSGLAAGFLAVAFVMSIFACVVLHEFGHAGAAAAFGIRTADITLLPIGGLARLTRIPDKPYQELIIALAGPAVNLVIAAVLLPFAMLGLQVGESAPALGSGLDFVSQLLAANIVLAIFNLLPAFPMDGGRVLRSLLAMRTDHLRATEIAAGVGRWMALFFGLIGIMYWQLGLVLLAGFIYLAGTAELMGVRMRARQSQWLGPEESSRAFSFGDSESNSDPFSRVRPNGVQSGEIFGQPFVWQVQSWPNQRTSSQRSASSSRQSARGNTIDALEVRELDR